MKPFDFKQYVKENPLLKEEKKEKLDELFDPTSFYQGQLFNRAIQSASHTTLSTAEIILSIVILGIGLGIAGLTAMAIEKNPIKAFKRWLSNRNNAKQLAPIIDRLKKDPEIMKYVANKNLRGIKKAILSKLSPEEQKYIGSLTRSALSDTKQ
jgi:hypothetical protein